MKMVVDDIMALIIGKEISLICYAANMLCINIGNEIEYVNYKGQNDKRYEYSLHIQAPWRISGENKIFVAWADGKRADEIESFIYKAKIVSIYVAGMGDLKVVLDNGYIFEAFVDSMDECWRLVTQQKHMVCYGDGIFLE